MADRLPFDVWIAIAAYLSGKSIVSLGQTCKDLHATMQERLIWSSVLGDILDVVRLPIVRHSMHNFSVAELKSKAAHLSRIDSLFDRESIQPTHVDSYPVNIDVSQAVIAPGGKSIILMITDGTLHVYQTRDLSGAPDLIVARPETPAEIFHRPFPSLLIESANSHHIAVTCDDFVTDQSEEYAEFRIYRVDFQVPAMELLTTVTRHNCYGNFLFQEGFFVSRWNRGENHLVGIRKIAAEIEEVEEEVIVDMGTDEEYHQSRIKILCPHQFALSSKDRLHLFQIPPMVPVATQLKQNIVRASPISAHIFEGGGGENVWNKLCEYHHKDSRAATAAQMDGRQYVLLIWPTAGQPSGTFVRHPCHWYDLGHGRAIWLHHTEGHEEIVLRMCAHLTRPDNHIGYARLGRSGAPDPSKVVLIPLIQREEDFEIEDLSFDETEGRVCLLVSSLDADDSRRVLVVNLI